MAVFGLFLGFLIAGDLLYFSTHVLGIPAEALRQPSSPRALPPCMLLSDFHHLQRSIQIHLEPGEARLDFIAAAENGDKCAEILEANGFEGVVAKFVRNTFGRTTVNGDDLQEGDFSATSTSTDSSSKSVIFQFHARVVRLLYPSIAIERRYLDLEHGAPPLADRIEMAWRDVRVTGLVPQPQMLAADRALIQGTAQRPIFHFYVNVWPLDEKSAKVPRSTSQSFLRRLSESLQVPVLSTGLAGLAFIAPFLLFLQQVPRPGAGERFVPEFADTLVAGTRALVAFHLSLFFFLVASSLPGLNVLQEARVDLAQWLSAIWPVSPYELLGRGVQYLAFAWVAILLPPILRRYMDGGRTSEKNDGRILRCLLAAAFSVLAIAGLIEAYLQLDEHGDSAPLWCYFLAAASLGLLLLWPLYWAMARLVTLRLSRPELAVAAALTALVAMALKTIAVAHRDVVRMI